MGFSNSKLHLLSEEAYNLMLFNSIGSSEGLESTVKNIGDGVATIGYGYTLNSHSNNLDTFIAAKIPLTQAQKDALSIIDQMVNNHKSNTEITNYALSHLSSLTINATLGLSLFRQSVSQYENSIIKMNLELSIERVALVNIAYNTPARLSISRAPNLVTAIQNGDRIATWYYLRFPEDQLATVDKKYKVGILNRHFDASTSFNCFDNDFSLEDSSGKNYIKYMYRFLSEKKDDAIKYVQNILQSSTNSSSFHGEIGVAKEIEIAKQKIITEFSQGITIDGDIIIGQGIGESGEVYADKTIDIDDTDLKYTDKNDLIFGERGDDTLIGGAGSDVLYGGDGFDTYITDNGDTILDSDHQGKVTFEDIELKGAVWNPWTGEYESISNKNETYTLDNDTLTITHEDKTLTIENYSKEDKSLSIDLNSYLTLEIEDARFKEDDDTHNEKIGFKAFTLTNLLTCKDFQSNKSLHVRIKIKQKGATYGVQPKVA